MTTGMDPLTERLGATLPKTRFIGLIARPLQSLMTIHSGQTESEPVPGLSSGPRDVKITQQNFQILRQHATTCSGKFRLVEIQPTI